MSDNTAENVLPVDIIMDTVLDGLIVIDSQGLIQRINKAAERIFQYSPEEVIGKNVHILMPEPYHSQHNQYFTNYLTSGDKKVIGIGREVSAQRKDGSIFPMELGVNEMEIGGVRMFIGTIRDITLRKRAEEDVLSQRNHLQAVVNTVLDGVITINAEGVMQSFNPAAEKIFQYKAQEVIGKNVKVLMPNPYHDGHDQYLKNYFSTNEKKVIGIGRQVMAQRKDGTAFPIELGVNEMSVDGTRMFVGIIRDITERVESEKSIRSYLEKLKRSNQELDDFAYIASHDLKEPLRGVSNNALFLEEDYGDVLGDDGKRRLHRMKYLCKRLDTLVDDLLYYSRLGRQELAIKTTDLNTVINDIALMMESSLHEANAEIIIPKSLPTIVCDVPRITEVFRNLITNAIKYNDEVDKTVEIGVDFYPVQNAPEKSVFYVRDNGIGIDEKFYDDVFRIFKRLNDEADDKKGTGVGLTFVKKIIERHNGKIWIESELGKGTTFYFTLTSQKQKID